jgi:hypothetical protein
MYATPTIVNFQTLFDLIFRALSIHPQDHTYTVILGKIVIPEGTSPNDVYSKYGPCGPNPFYYFRFFTVNGEEVKVNEPFNYLTISGETLQKIKDTRNVQKLAINEFSGHSFVFTPSTYQKSELYDQTEPFLEKNKFAKWMVIPDVCIDKEGRFFYREDKY